MILSSKLSKQFFSLYLAGCSLLAATTALAQNNGNPPQLTNTGSGSVTYQEDGEPAPVISNVQVQDTDSENLSLATFQFGEDYDPDLDKLVFEETENIRSYFDENSGTLYLLAFPASIGVSINQMQAAIRSVAYTSTSDDPGKRKVSLSMTVTDTEGNRSAPVNKSVSIEPQNDNPTVSSDRTAPQEVSINREYQIFDDLFIQDPDSRIFSQAVIQLEEGFNQDRLGFQGGRRGLDIEIEARVVTIRGESDLNTYLRVIEDVTYQHDPFFFRQSGIRKISLQLTDNEGGASNRLNRYFIVQPLSGARINVPPSLGNIEIETNEGEAYNFDADLFTDAFNDQNGSSLIGIILESLPEHGQLFLGNQEINNQFVIDNTLIRASDIANLRYVPAPLYNGEDQFSWNARDADNFAANPAQVRIEVEPVNQPPQLSFPANADVEEDTPTAFNGLDLEDPDRETLLVSMGVDRGTLAISQTLVDRDLVDFISGTENGEAVIIFTAPAALAAYAFSSLIYLPEENFAGNDAIRIEVGDNEGGDAEGTINLSVLLVNDAPELLNLESEPVTYTEDAEPVNITTNITVTDEEANQISGATVSISEGYAGDQDNLTFVSQGNISGTFEGGVLSLSGAASTAAYQTALRSVRFFNNSDNPTTENRIVSFTVTDEEGAESEAASRELRVEPVNDAPVLIGLEENPLGYIPEGQPISVTETLTVSDPDNETLLEAVFFFDQDEYDDDEDLLTFVNTDKITASWNEDEGIMTLSGEATLAEYQEAIRNVRYQNLSDEIDEDTKIINIKVSDGTSDSNVVQRELVANQPPLISSFARSTDEEEPLSFTATDFPFEDPDNFPTGELFGIIITELPGKGVITFNGDTLNSDDLNQTLVEVEDLEQLLYRPLPDSTGTDSFGWNASDSASFAQIPAQVNITINPLPDPPRPEDFIVQVTEDEAYSFTAAQFAAASTDPDGDDLASVVIRSVPEQGTLLLNSIALPPNSQLNLGELDNLAYLPDNNYTGEDSFSWAASDGENTSSETASVLITITDVNDAPIVSSFTRAINEGEPYAFSVEDFRQNYLDIENSPLAAIRTESLPTEGSLLLNGNVVSAGAEISVANINNLVYQPSEEMGGGIISFDWTASDGALFAETPAEVNIIIGVGVTDFSISALEDETYTFSRLQFANNYGNPDATLASVRIEELPENGSLLLDNENLSEGQEISAETLAQLSYLPDPNFFGEDSFSWNASGGDGFATQAADVLISVAPVNDTPQISPISDQTLLAGATSEPIVFEISDQESEAGDLSVSVFSSDNNIIPAEQISLGGSGSERSLTLTPLDDTEGSVIITVVASDGEEQAEMEFVVEVAPYAVRLEADSELDICTEESGMLPISITGGQAPYELQVVCESGECEGSFSFSDNTLTFNPIISETYFISLVDANGVRSNTDTIQVNVLDCTNLDLEIPTAITPNGDQVNDNWEIGNIQYANNVVVEVYNRYGLQVFRSEGYAESWDGTYENNPLPVGTYYYMINVDGGTQLYNGSVTILR